MDKNKIKNLFLEEENKLNIQLNKKVLETPISKKNEEKTSKNNLRYLLASLTTCCLIIVMCICFFPFKTQTVQAEITSYILEINPAFCITCDREDNVLNISSLNEDANYILEKSYFNNVVNLNFNSCIYYIINSIDENIFKNYGSNKIKIYAVSDNFEETNDKLKNFGNIIRSNLDIRGYNNIEFEKEQISIEIFKNKMGFNNNSTRLDDMKNEIIRHNKYFR